MQFQARNYRLIACIFLHRLPLFFDDQLNGKAVVQPDSISEIQSLFQFSHDQKIPLTFRAAGTSLSGQAITDGILVDLSKHWGKIQVEDQGNLIRETQKRIQLLTQTARHRMSRTANTKEWLSEV